jgi:hypothetical protein
MTSVEGAVQTPQQAATAAAPARAGARPVVVAALALCGGLLVCAYLFFLVVVPQTAVRLGKTSAGLDHRLALWRWLRSLSISVPEGRTLLTALVAAVVGGFAVYLAAVFVARSLPSSRRLVGAIVATAVVFTAASALAFPNLDTDVYTYIATGRVAAVHHRDPYAIATDRYRSDPFYKYELPQYTHYPDIKLPAWMPINIGLAEVAGNDPATALLVYRGAFAAFALANLGLVLLIVRKLRPERLTEAAVAWAWNPLVVLFAQSKVDSVMVFFMLVSLLALVHARRYLGLVFMTLATFVKLLTAPFLAMLWLQDVRRRRWRSLVASTALMLGTIAVLYAPYSHQTRLLVQHVGLVSHTGAAGGANAGARALLLLGGVIAVAALALRRERTLPETLRLWAAIGVCVAVLAVAGGFPWYLLTFFALVVVAGDVRLLAALSVLSVLSLTVYERHSNSTRAHPLPHLSPVSLAATVFLLVALAAAAVGGARLLRRGRAGSVAPTERVETLQD